MGWIIALIIIGFVVISYIRRARNVVRDIERHYYKEVKLIWLYAGASEGVATIRDVNRTGKRSWDVRVEIEGQTFQFSMTVPKRAHVRIEVGAPLPILYNYGHREAVLHPMYYEWLKGDDVTATYGVGAVYDFIQQERTANE